jgi:Tol biopolymer transport system component
MGGLTGSVRGRRAVWIAVAVAVAALVTVEVSASGSARPAARVANGEWIAYATAPASDQGRRAGYSGGSDVFVVRPSGAPILVSGRGKGAIWNVCPAFSPNGRLLAFGQKSPQGQSIRVVGIAPDGAVIEKRIVLKVHKASGPCPKWSSDSKRLAYLDSNGTLAVVTLGGARRLPKAGDPRAKDFSRSDDALVSPDGTLVARRDPNSASCEVVVSRRDGSDKRVVDAFPCSYATAGWSPDSRQLLIMKDMDGRHFAIVAVPVNAPANAAPVVVGVRVNHARSWPGYGDVSWQPRPQR